MGSRADECFRAAGHGSFGEHRGSGELTKWRAQRGVVAQAVTSSRRTRAGEGTRVGAVAAFDEAAESGILGAASLETGSGRDSGVRGGGADRNVG